MYIINAKARTATLYRTPCSDQRVEENKEMGGKELGKLTSMEPFEVIDKKKGRKFIEWRGAVGGWSSESNPSLLTACGIGFLKHTHCNSRQSPLPPCMLV